MHFVPDAGKSTVLGYGLPRQGRYLTFLNLAYAAVLTYSIEPY